MSKINIQSIAIVATTLSPPLFAQDRPGECQPNADNLYTQACIDAIEVDHAKKMAENLDWAYASFAGLCSNVGIQLPQELSTSYSGDVGSPPSCSVLGEFRIASGRQITVAAGSIPTNDDPTFLFTNESLYTRGPELAELLQGEGIIFVIDPTELDPAAVTQAINEIAAFDVVTEFVPVWDSPADLQAAIDRIEELGEAVTGATLSDPDLYWGMQLRDR
jgi:hypothetical protein